MADGNEYKGAGWYRISYSDGGQDWTNDGPVWLDDRISFDAEMDAESAHETDTHIAYAEYLGDSESPVEPRTLAQIRDDAGMTQQQLADKLGVPQSQVARWESGRVSPNAKAIASLASALGTDANAIVAAVNH